MSSKKPQPVGDDLNSITVEFLSKFNAQKDAIEKSIKAVSLATRQINSLADQVKTAFNPDDIERLSNKLADLVKSAQQEAQLGKKLLDNFKREGESLMRTHPKSDRLQPYKAQYMRLCKQYVEVMKEHQRVKENMRNVQTEDLVRRGTIIYGNRKSENEIREEVERNPAGFVRQAIMLEAAEEAQHAYAEAQSRAKDVEMLVASINEVAALVQDLAVLVQQQSEMLDSIEENVESAGMYIKKGNEEMRSAIKHQKRTRKCMCCFIIIGVILVAAVLAGVGAFFGINK